MRPAVCILSECVCMCVCVFMFYLFFHYDYAADGNRRPPSPFQNASIYKRIKAEGKSFIHLTELEGRASMATAIAFCLAPAHRSGRVRLKYICLDDLIGTPQGHLFLLLYNYCVCAT